MKISHTHPNLSSEEREKHLRGVHNRCMAAIRGNTRHIPTEDHQLKASVRGR